MIYINLLPWRESRLKKLRGKFCKQILLALIFPLVVSGFIRANQANEFEHKLTEINRFKATHEKVFFQISSFELEEAKSIKRREKTDHINALIIQRQRIPEVIALLIDKNISAQINYLSIDHQNIKIRGIHSSSKSALALFNSLRDKRVFCQIVFKPLGEETETFPFMEFELQAQLCNEAQAN